MNPYKQVIWDWNGTLVDDAWLCMEVLHKLMADRGMNSVDMARYREGFGFPVKDFCLSLLFEFKTETFEQVSVEFIAEYNRRRFECRLHSGAVSACCMDWRKALIIGDTNQTEINNIWHSSELKNIRTLHVQNRTSQLPLCNKCNYWRWHPRLFDYGTISVDSIRYKSPKRRYVTLDALRVSPVGQKIDKSNWNGFGAALEVITVPNTAQVVSVNTTDSVAIFLPFNPPPQSVLKKVDCAITDLAAGSPNIAVSLFSTSGFYWSGQLARSSSTGDLVNLEWNANIYIDPKIDYILMIVYEGIDNSKTSFHKAVLEFEIYEP